MKTICNKRTVQIIALLTFVFAIMTSHTYADAISPTVHDDTTVRVYLTMSYDSDFLRAGDDPDLKNRGGKVLARVPIDISYTDLAEYGLEGYYRYDSIDKEYGNYNSSAIAVQPTVLMLYLRATSLYYLEREIRFEDIGNKENGTESSTLTLSGGAQHLYFTRFWGHNENLMYYVNHEFPMWYSDQGATADFILLEEGDEIDVGMFSNMSFHTFGAFAYFNKTDLSAVPGEKIDMTLLSTATHEGSAPGIPMPGETIRISKDYGETWESNDIKTSSDGSFTISFDEPGVYYISAGPDFVKNVQNQMACVVPPISVATVSPVQASGGETCNTKDDKVKCTWNAQGSQVTYKVDYRTTGETEWKTAEVSEPQIAVDDVDKEHCEFRVTPMIRSEYVPYGESSRKIAAKAIVFRHNGYNEEMTPEEREEKERQEKERKEKALAAAKVKVAKSAKTTVSVKALKGHKARVTWKKVTLKYSSEGTSGSMLVTGYKVYRAAKKSGKYKLIKTIKKAGTLKYTDKKLKKGRKYYYKVRTYTKIDGGTYLGKWSKVKKITAK